MCITGCGYLWVCQGTCEEATCGFVFPLSMLYILGIIFMFLSLLSKHLCPQIHLGVPCSFHLDNTRWRIGRYKKSELYWWVWIHVLLLDSWMVQTHSNLSQGSFSYLCIYIWYNINHTYNAETPQTLYRICTCLFWDIAQPITCLVRVQVWIPSTNEKSWTQSVVYL